MSEANLEYQQDLAREIGKNNIIKFGQFTLSNGSESPVYIDLREVQSYPSTLRAAVKTYGDLLEDVAPDVALAGMPEAGTPLASATGYEFGRKLLQPRKVVKDHGTKSSVEGVYQPGESVVLIDDVITGGESKLAAIKQVEDAGLVVERILVLVDREQGGIDAVRAAGYDIQAAMTLSALLGILLQDGSLEQDQYDTVMSFIKDA